MQRLQETDDFSFKELFLPLTTVKVVTIIIIVGLIVYGNVFFNGFVGDDFPYIINNASLHQLNVISSFSQNAFNDAGQYRPLTVLFFSLLYNLFGNTAFFYHVIQIALQITNCILLFLLFKQYLSKGLSLFIVLVFLIHPMQVEAVSYIAQTDNLLFSFFGLLSVVLLTNKAITNRKLLLILFFSLLAILTKETGILFILLLLLYSFLFNSRTFLRLLIGSFLILLIYGFIRLFVGQVGLDIRTLTPIADLPLLIRIKNIPLIILYYLMTFIFPLKLATDQQWIIQSVDFLSFYLPLIIDSVFFIFLVSIGYYFFRFKKISFRIYLFFLTWFLLGLIFHLQIFPLDHTVFNAWFYFPMMGLLGLIGVSYQNTMDKTDKYKQVIIFIFILFITFLSIRTIVRNTDLKDSLTLYNHDIVINDNFEIEDNLGLEYLSRSDYPNAIKHIQNAVALRPYEANLQHLGIAYQDSGSIQKANYYLAKSVHANSYGIYNPHNHGIQTYFSYVSFLLLYNKSVQAITFLEQVAIPDYPNSWKLWMFLAIAKNNLHDKAGADQAAEKMYQFNPTESVFLYLMRHDTLTRQQLNQLLYSNY